MCVEPDVSVLHLLLNPGAAFPIDMCSLAFANIFCKQRSVNKTKQRSMFANKLNKH